MIGEKIPFEAYVTALKAAAEPTRLRIMMLLSHTGELNVKDLTLILGQSQPRLSRHLKLLAEAGLVERFREGSFAYFQASDRTSVQRIMSKLVTAIDANDAMLARDRDRAVALKRQREASAQAYFAKHASNWDHIRTLHVADSEVEAALMAAVAPDFDCDLMVDLGTGTGRMLELFQSRYRRALGFDVSHEMLAYARSRLSAAGLMRAQVRHGDLYNLTVSDASADLVIMHQVLHFLSDPKRALSEARRVLAPGGRLLIVDFAPHDFEELREAQAHERLGFSHGQMSQWLGEAGLRRLSAIDLAPPDIAGEKRAANQKLTVTLWVATPGVLRATTAPTADALATQLARTA